MGLRWIDRFGCIIDVHFDGFLNAAVAQAEAGLVAVGLEHQLQRIAKSGPAFDEGSAEGDCSGNFFDPADVSPVFRSDDRVVSLSHHNIVVEGCGRSQQKFREG